MITKNINKYFNFQENRSYSLWVTAYDGSIPQKTEVYATISDKSGTRPKLPHPPTLNFPAYPNIPLQPKFPRTTQSTTKATQNIYVTVPEETTTLTTLSPPKPPDDSPGGESIVQNDDKNASTEAPNKNLTTNEMPLTVIPLIAIGGLVVIVAAVILFVCRKNNAQKKDNKKDDMVSNKI